MTNSSLTIQVPGKLMVAGEFAVLEPYQKLAVMAVNRYVYATIETSELNNLTLENFHLNRLSWTFNHKQVHIHANDSRLSFVQNAMMTVLNYLQEKSIHTPPFHLSIKSELDDGAGKKYGLGSSAAVVTAVTAAILHAFDTKKPSPKLIFKLASISHVKTQGNGSGADVAASSYGGFLQYSSFQADWLLKRIGESIFLSNLVEQDWTYLSIKPIHLPKQMNICIGWTGSPASTGSLVKQVLKLKNANVARFQQFLKESEEAVKHFLTGMQQSNMNLLLHGVKQNRHALATVGKAANVSIETPLLGKLCDLSEQFGGAGKPSGAGGGDCGIAFLPLKKKAIALMKEWEETGITPLEIQPTFKGATIIEKSGI